MPWLPSQDFRSYTPATTFPKPTFPRLERYPEHMRLILFAFTACLSAAPTPTFYKDVLPVLQRNCQACHRPGEAAPMSLLTYQDTRPWAKAIRQAVLTKKMPPWLADPAHGKFADERPEAGRDRGRLRS